MQLEGHNFAHRADIFLGKFVQNRHRRKEQMEMQNAQDTSCILGKGR